MVCSIWKKITKPVNVDNDEEMKALIASCIGTKFITRWKEQMCTISLNAIRMIVDDSDGKRDIDIKKIYSS